MNRQEYFNKLAEPKKGKIFKAFVLFMMSPDANMADEFDDLDEDFTESVKLINQIYPGSIYMFNYKSSLQSIYDGPGADPKKPLPFIDNSPIVFVLSVNGDNLRGINFNFCTRPVRIAILSMLTSLDLDYFTGGASQLAASGKLPISEKILKTMQAQNVEQLLLTELHRIAKDVNFEFAFRTYKISLISNIRYIEPFMWQYLPDYQYSGKLNGAIIKKIQLLTGMTQLTNP